MNILDTVNYPKDIRGLSLNSLQLLATELKTFIIDTVLEKGGHLASNLGVIELTIALHYCFNTPDDKLVWDIGHQAYAHKVLTGRKKNFETIRQYNGISGFLSRTESEYDVFGAGHAATSISAALGVDLAGQLLQQNNKVVAIIGDGAITAGLALEGLNNVGYFHNNLIIVLNDNGMSISPNVGAISYFLAKLLANKTNMVLCDEYVNLEQINDILKRLDKLQNREVTRYSNLFENFGIHYVGPVDGHNLASLLDCFTNIKNNNLPCIVHVSTVKGYAYKAAVDDPIKYHGCKKISNNKKENTVSYSQLFGHWLLNIAKYEEEFAVVTPAMIVGSGLSNFAEKYPQKCFDVGIAEQHALTVAAGMSVGGLNTIVSIYSTFLQRAYDQLIHDIAIQNLPVMIAVDRAGLVPSDGATHSGIFDLSFSLCIPNVVIMVPSSLNELYLMLYIGFYANFSCIVRYPKDSVIDFDINSLPTHSSIMNSNLCSLSTLKAKIMRFGVRVAILVFGRLLDTVLEVAEVLNATVCDMRVAKPVDESMIVKLYSEYECIVTVEDGVIIGGIGSYCVQVAQRMYFYNKTLNIGINDEFITHGDLSNLYKHYKLDAVGILHSICNYFNL